MQPLFFATPIHLGGLGFAPPTIGLVLGLQGAISGVGQAMLFAPLHRRFGTKTIYIIATSAYVLLFWTFPLMNELAKKYGSQSLPVWSVILLHTVLSCGACMSFCCIFIFVTSSAPSKTTLGATNGLAQTTVSVMRALGPAGASSLFALSIQKNLAGGWLVYWVLSGMGVAAVVVSTALKDEGRASSSDDQNAGDSDDEDEA